MKDTLPQRVAVIGGGVMGVDIAAIFCAAGMPVEIMEPDHARWDAAQARLAESIRQLHPSSPAARMPRRIRMKSRWTPINVN